MKSPTSTVAPSPRSKNTRILPPENAPATPARPAASASPVAPAPAPARPAAPAQTVAPVQPVIAAPPVVTTTPRRWPRIVGYGALAILTVTAAGAYGAYSAWLGNGRIAPGLYIQGEPVGGLTKAQARKRLEKHFGRLFVTVQTPARPYKLSIKQLGGEPQIERTVENAYWFGRSDNVFKNVIDVFSARQNERRLSLPVKWDKDQLRSTMWVVAKNFYQEPHDAELQVTDDGVQIVAEQTGRAMNVGATLKDLQHKYYVGLPEITATVREVSPRVVAASLAGTDVKLNQYTTYFNSGIWGRTRNIYRASETIDGKVLMPGEVFSFNKSTGERTYDKGYRMAHIFERKPGKAKAEVVDGLAGGVCQVSSTLYNAVRRANNSSGGHLHIVERNFHSLPVTYVPAGLDATVAWPNKDFRFRNDFAHPIYLRAVVDGSKLTISVWARVPDDVSKMIVSANEDESGESEDSQRQARSF